MADTKLTPPNDGWSEWEPTTGLRWRQSRWGEDISPVPEIETRVLEQRFTRRRSTPLDEHQQRTEYEEQWREVEVTDDG